jgi:hypothetical protein
MSNIINFDPKRRRTLRLPPYKTRKDVQLVQLWVEDRVTVLELMEGLRAAGLQLKSKGKGDGFVIVKQPRGRNDG